MFGPCAITKCKNKCRMRAFGILTSVSLLALVSIESTAYSDTPIRNRIEAEHILHAVDEEYWFTSDALGQTASDASAEQVILATMSFDNWASQTRILHLAQQQAVPQRQIDQNTTKRLRKLKRRRDAERKRKAERKRNAQRRRAHRRRLERERKRRTEQRRALRKRHELMERKRDARRRRALRRRLELDRKRNARRRLQRQLEQRQTTQPRVTPPTSREQATPSSADLQRADQHRRALIRQRRLQLQQAEDDNKQVQTPTRAELRRKRDVEAATREIKIRKIRLLELGIISRRIRSIEAALARSNRAEPVTVAVLNEHVATLLNRIGLLATRFVEAPILSDDRDRVAVGGDSNDKLRAERQAREGAHAVPESLDPSILTAGLLEGVAGSLDLPGFRYPRGPAKEQGSGGVWSGHRPGNDWRDGGFIYDEHSRRYDYIPPEVRESWGHLEGLEPGTPEYEDAATAAYLSDTLDSNTPPVEGRLSVFFPSSDGEPDQQGIAYYSDANGRWVDEDGNPLEEEPNTMIPEDQTMRDFEDPAVAAKEIEELNRLLDGLEAEQAKQQEQLTHPLGGDGKGGTGSGGDGKGGTGSGGGSTSGSQSTSGNENTGDSGSNDNDNDNNPDDANTNQETTTGGNQNENDNENDNTGEEGQPAGGRATGAGPYGGQSPAGQLRGAIKVDPGGRRLPEERDRELDTEDPDQPPPNPTTQPGPREPGAAASDSEGSGVPGTGITGEGTGLGSRGQGPTGKKPPKPTVNPAPDDQDGEAPELNTRQRQQSPLRIPKPDDPRVIPSIGQQQ